MNMKTKRILMSVVGVAICGIFAGLFQYVAFGVDPFQCFVNGFSALLPHVAFGTLYLFLNIGLLLFSLLCDRHCIGIATFINMFLLGYIVQFTVQGLNALLPAPSLALRIVLMPVALLGLSLSASLYITADLGVSTYDAVALIMANKWKLMRFRYCRILTDFCCVVIGSVLFLLSGKSFSQLFAIAGIGTILTAFFMGPVIEWCDRHISKPLLGKE